MTASSLGSIAKEAVAWSIGLSVLMILAGALAILILPAAEIAVLAVVAWLLTLSGISMLFSGSARLQLSLAARRVLGKVA